MIEANKDIESKLFKEMTLNDEQQLAIKSIAKGTPVQIIASAGTGKTRTLVCAVKWLIEACDVKPSEILCLSYSNASAKDLRAKLTDINISNSKRLHTGKVAATTFHSLGYSFLPRSDIINLDDIIIDYLIRGIYNGNENVIRYITPETAYHIMHGKQAAKTNGGYYHIKGVDDFFNVQEYVEKEPFFTYHKTYNSFRKTQTDVPALQSYARNKKSRFYNYRDVGDLFEKYIEEISSWISMFKEHEYTKQYLDEIYENEKNGEHGSLMTVIYDIYKEYHQYQKNSGRIDFQDMITKGTQGVHDVEELKYVFVDEYQDISFTRNRLLQTVLAQSNAQLIVAGDDWQAIYGFNGCRSEYFSDFKKYYPNAQQIILNQTYRLSNELAQASGAFIDNDTMISKQLTSNRKLDNPIVLHYYKENSKDEARRAFKLLCHIVANAKTEEDKEIYILYRCRSDKNDLNLLLNLKNYEGRKNFYEHFNLFREVYDEDTGKVVKEKTVKFMTLHKAKGLEAKNVIILGVDQDTIPIRPRDEKLFRYVSFTEDYDLSLEERRLFYVGLSRATNNVYIFCKAGVNDKTGIPLASQFIFEIDPQYIDVQM